MWGGGAGLRAGAGESSSVDGGVGRFIATSRALRRLPPDADDEVGREVVHVEEVVHEVSPEGRPRRRWGQT